MLFLLGCFLFLVGFFCWVRVYYPCLVVSLVLVFSLVCFLLDLFVIFFGCLRVYDLYCLFLFMVFVVMSCEINNNVVALIVVLFLWGVSCWAFLLIEGLRSLFGLL